MVSFVEAVILLHLIRLHTPSGQEIGVSPDQVVTIREPQVHENHFPRNTRCILNMADGKFNLVVEDCQTVRRLIEEIQK